MQVFLFNNILLLLYLVTDYEEQMRSRKEKIGMDYSDHESEQKF